MKYQQPKFNKYGLTQWYWIARHHENLKLGQNVQIGNFTVLGCEHGIEIGNNVQIGYSCSIFTHSSVDGKSGPIKLADNCKVGANSVIMPGLTIGDNATVGANSFVKNSIPANEIWAGSPARLIGRNQKAPVLPGMIEINCPLCAERNFRFLYQKQGFNLVKCRKCGLVLTNPRWSQTKLKEMYNKDYFYRPKKSLNDYSGYEDYNKRYISGKEKIRNQLTLDKIEQFTSKKGRLLDVGAASGFFVKDAQDRGWQAEGVEISPWAVNYAKNKLKVKIFEGELKDKKYASASFNVVTMNDFLEHVQNPMAELVEACRISKQDGLLYVETLNFDGLINRRFIGKKYVHMVPSLHLTYFGRKQLLQMLSQAGFKIKKVEITSSSVGDFEYEGIRMYWRYFQFIILSIFGLKKVKNWAFKDIIKIIAQK